MNFFKGMKTTQEIKDEYRRLAKIHHPDIGGDLRTMQQINAEYAVAMANALRAEKPGQTDAQYESAESIAESIRAAIERIIALNGIEIEICGLWVWVSGNTYAVKGALKEAEYRWSPKKEKWYFAGVASSGRGNWSMEDIRDRYGSETIKRERSGQAHIH